MTRTVRAAEMARVRLQLASAYVLFGGLGLAPRADRRKLVDASNVAISEAFLTFLVAIFGRFHQYFDAAGKFMFEEFRDSQPPSLHKVSPLPGSKSRWAQEQTTNAAASARLVAWRVCAVPGHVFGLADVRAGTDGWRGHRVCAGRAGR